MSDVLILRGVRAEGCHGALPGERDFPQPFGVDLEIELDVTEAAAADDLGSTVDYAEVASAVHAVVATESFALLERLATAVADRVLGFDRVEAVTVTLAKLQPPMSTPVDCVAVRLRRTR